MISWKSQTDGEENKKYYLQFETDNQHYYKVMEKVSQSLIDFENNTANQMTDLLRTITNDYKYTIDPNMLLAYFIFLRLGELEDKE